MKSRNSLLAGITMIALALGTSPARAGVALPRVVSEDPAGTTPHALQGEIADLAQSGDTMYAAGSFSQVQPPNRSVTLNRRGVFAFATANGAIAPLDLRLDGSVARVLPSGTSLFVGGTFQRVGVAPRPWLAKWDLTNNRLDPTFVPAGINGKVTDIHMVRGRLYVSGDFTKKLVALDPTTGADTGFVNLSITGTLSDLAGPTGVGRFAVHPEGNRLVMLGNFTAINGSGRRQIAQLLLGTSATLSSWYDPLWNYSCAASVPQYTRDVDFSPRGSQFSVVTSGGQYAYPKLCDSIATYATDDDPTAVAVWINYTSQDTLLSVSHTGAVVYAGGHQRAVNVRVVQNGRTVHTEPVDSLFTRREGISAYDNATGYAIAWNPGRTRGVGARRVLSTSAGLWVGSDTDRFNGEYHGRLAFCPLPK